MRIQFKEGEGLAKGQSDNIVAIDSSIIIIKSMSKLFDPGLYIIVDST